MSRRYRIEVSAPQTPQTTSTAFGPPASAKPLPTAFQSFFPLDVLGTDLVTVNTSYLDVEFDLSTNSASAMNQGAQMITIKGIDPGLISQVNTLNGMEITVYGGFAKGMPLATAMSKLGWYPLVKGYINGAFGNWVGTDLYICLPIFPYNAIGTRQSDGTILYPDFTLNGAKGEKWQAVIQRGLQQAMPDIQPKIEIRDELVLSEDHQGTGYSLDSIGQLIADLSSQLLGTIPNYAGIRTYWRAGDLHVTDSLQPSGAKTVTITAEQLLGNPVWTSATNLQVVCPMRSDIYINDTVIIDPNALAIIQTNYTKSNAGGSLGGKYVVNTIRHLGRSRSPQALEWATIYDLIYQGSASPSTTTATDGTQPFGS